MNVRIWTCFNQIPLGSSGWKQSCIHVTSRNYCLSLFWRMFQIRWSFLHWQADQAASQKLKNKHASFTFGCDSQATMGGLISAPLSAVSTPEGPIISNFLEFWQSSHFRMSVSHCFSVFLWSVAPGRNLLGRLFWQLPCNQLLLGPHLEKTVVQKWDKSPMMACR